MSRNHKLEKIRKLSDEVDELGQRRSGISQESVEGLQELAEIQGHVRHKQDQIAKLFRQVERNELNALVQRLKQNKI
jgi:uncharacterized coiled-coil DUF342 family protein